jgi:hypothetical protein
LLLALCLQLIVNGQHVRGFVVEGKLGKRFFDQAMLMSVEIAL